MPEEYSAEFVRRIIVVCEKLNEKTFVGIASCASMQFGCGQWSAKEKPENERMTTYAETS